MTQVRMIQEVAFGADPQDRFAGMRALIERLGSDPAGEDSGVLVLPEMWPVGFFNFDGYRDFADRHFTDYQEFVRTVSATSKCWTFGGSAPCRVGDAYVNRSVVSSPSGDLYTFDKLHLFAHQSREAEVLTRGDTLVAFDGPFGETGILTCFDLRFPECFRPLRDAGCEAFVVVAAWPAPRVSHWKALLRARAIENQAWVIGVNATGEDFGTDLGGGSMVIGPDGSVVADLTDEPVSDLIDVDPGLPRRVRAQFPFHASTIGGLLGHAATFPIAASV